MGKGRCTGGVEICHRSCSCGIGHPWSLTQCDGLTSPVEGGVQKRLPPQQVDRIHGVDASRVNTNVSRINLRETTRLQ